MYKGVGRANSNHSEINLMIEKYDKNRDGGIDRKELLEIFKTIIDSTIWFTCINLLLYILIRY